MAYDQRVVIIFIFTAPAFTQHWEKTETKPRWYRHLIYDICSADKRNNGKTQTEYDSGDKTKEQQEKNTHQREHFMY